MAEVAIPQEIGPYRVEREAKLLASLNHPRIGAIYALQEHQGARYLVLELVEGRVLKEVVADGPLPVELALDYCRQIADALPAAHTKGVMHRDLKPANVIVTADAGVKVLDFGLAKSLVEVESSSDSTVSLLADRTIEGTVVGTPGYMSPEQSRGAPVDTRSDVWSFGCILYECLTGRPAFAGRNVADVLAATLVADPVWADLPTELPDVVPELIRRCLQKEPDLRLADIHEAREVLDQLIAGARPTMSTSLNAAPAANNLPTQVTSFVGRHRGTRRGAQRRRVHGVDAWQVSRCTRPVPTGARHSPRDRRPDNDRRLVEQPGHRGSQRGRLRQGPRVARGEPRHPPRTVCLLS